MAPARARRGNAHPPPRRKPPRAGAGPAIAWGVAGAVVAGLLVAGLFYLDGSGGPRPGLTVAGATATPTAAPPRVEAPAPIVAPPPATLTPSQDAALLPDSPAASPAPAALIPAPAPALAPAPGGDHLSDPAAPSDTPLPPAAMPGPAPYAGLEEIVTRPPTALAVYRARHNPRVLILDFPSFGAQALAMNRMAALIEKKGLPRDRVMSDGELRRAIADAGKDYDTFYGGHDYSGEALARFYTLAEAGGITVAEGEVLEILLKHRVLRVARKGFVAGDPAQAVISIAAAGAGQARGIEFRRNVLRHEFSHGEFFTHAYYRAQCDRFWRELMSEAERKAFRRYLSKLDYDTDDEFLVINEMQAYLGYTLAPRLFGAHSLDMTEADFQALRERFRARVVALADF